MNATGDSSSRSGGAAPGPSDGRDSSERRSVRRQARRRQKASRLFYAVAPAVAVIAVVAVLFPMLASPGPSEGTNGGTTASTQTTGATVSVSTTTPTAPAGSGAVSGSPSAVPRRSALLAVIEDGKAAVLEFVIGGPNGGLVLGFPGVTLLRAGDRFAQLSGLYAPDQLQSLQQTVAAALAAPVPAIASMNWGDLRDTLAASGIGPLPAQKLDARDGDAGQVAEAIAAVLGKSGADAGDAVWGGKVLAGDASGFLAAVAAGLRAAQGARWTGRGVAGTLVQTSDFTYLEPDITTARSVLTATGAGG